MRYSGLYCDRCCREWVGVLGGECPECHTMLERLEIGVAPDIDPELDAWLASLEVVA